MAALAQTSLLTPVLRRLPSRLLAALDAWSYRIALKRAQRRREAGRQRAEAAKRKQTALKS
jgi:hypothetical protein